MTTTGQNLTLWAGDTKAIATTITGDDALAVNLTGATIKYAVARNTATTKEFEKTIGSGITVVSAVAGTITITINPADTQNLSGSYVHELEITDSTGRKATVFTGTFYVNGAIYNS